MQQRRRFKQTVTLDDRLAAFAADMREKAVTAEPGMEREDLLKRARRAETASHLNEWANSSGLQSPK